MDTHLGELYLEKESSNPHNYFIFSGHVQVYNELPKWLGNW